MRGAVNRRGIRHIPTIQTLRYRRPVTREQLVARLALLEHERARVHRELAVWTAKHERTLELLRQADEEIAAVQKSLLPETQSPPSSSPGQGVTRANTDQERPADGKPGWQEITLEY